MSIGTKLWGDDNIPAKYQEFDSFLKLSARAFSNALMHIVGEEPGIIEVLGQDVWSSRLRRGIVDLPVRTSHGYVDLFEFHSGPISQKTVVRNYQYAIDIRSEIEEPVKPHFVSLDSKKTPVPTVELFPGVYSNPEVTYFEDIDGKIVLNTIIEKIDNQEKLDEMDAYNLALLPFFKNEKSREEMLEYMCHFINEIELSEEFKYIIKLVQILSVNALFTDKKQEEFLGVVKMQSTYIERYERNLIENSNNEIKRSIALKMKEDGVSSDFIFKYFGIML